MDIDERGGSKGKSFLVTIMDKDPKLNMLPKRKVSCKGRRSGESPHGRITGFLEEGCNPKLKGAEVRCKGQERSHMADSGKLDSQQPLEPVQDYLEKQCPFF